MAVSISALRRETYSNQPVSRLAASTRGSCSQYFLEELSTPSAYSPPFKTTATGALSPILRRGRARSSAASLITARGASGLQSGGLAGSRWPAASCVHVSGGG